MPTVEQLEKLLGLDPDDTFVLYGLAQAHAKEGRHEEAVRYYDRCLGEDPEYLYAYYHKARSLEAMELMGEATESLRAGLGASRAAGDDHAASEMQQFLDSLGS